MEEKPSGRNPSFYRRSSEALQAFPGWPMSCSPCICPVPGITSYFNSQECSVHGLNCSWRLHVWGLQYTGTSTPESEQSCPHYLMYRKHWVSSIHWASNSQHSIVGISAHLARVWLDGSQIVREDSVVTPCHIHTLVTPMLKSCTCTSPIYTQKMYFFNAL